MAVARFLLNPTFSIETGELLSHDGESFEEPKILFDRELTKRVSKASRQIPLRTSREHKRSKKANKYERNSRRKRSTRKVSILPT